MSQPHVCTLKESLPLSLAIAICWEKRVCHPDTPPGTILILGAFLVSMWCSLRFRDLQRIKWSSFIINPSHFAGNCWRTKTSRTGQPFAGITNGFFPRAFWAWTYFQTLDKCWARTRKIADQSIVPDFLLPDVEPGDSEPTAMAPMSYGRAMVFLRNFCAWAGPECTLHAKDYTMHSLKTTMLAWVAQLSSQSDCSAENRRLQGHHKDRIMPSVRLYSRSDTHGPLSLQACIQAQVNAGFRPQTPLHRGIQAVHWEPIVNLRESVPTSAFAFPTLDLLRSNPFTGHSEDVACSHALAVQARSPLPARAGQSATASPSGAEDTSSESTRSAESSDLGEADECYYLVSSGCFHAAVPKEDHCQSLYARQYWKPACGVLGQLEFTSALPKGMRPCHRRACLKRFPLLVSL